MHLAFGELQLKTENRNLLGTWKLEETLAKEMTWEGASPTIFQAPLTLVDSRGEGYGMRTYHMPGHDLGYPCSFSPSCFFFLRYPILCMDFMNWIKVAKHTPYGT
jgi:hypothetical protein